MASTTSPDVSNSSAPKPRKKPKKPAASSADWLDDRDLAARTPISRSQWQLWRRAGDGPPFYRVGGRRVLYRWSEVEAWLAARPAVR